jgi:hypothetical protein
MATSRQKAHSYISTSKPQKDHGPDDWLNSKERADHDDAPITCAVYAEESAESNKKLLRAPLMRPIALPSTEETSHTESEELCSRPDIGWYTGRFDGVPKMVAPEHLSFTLPVPFPVDEGLLAGKP